MRKGINKNVASNTFSSAFVRYAVFFFFFYYKHINYACICNIDYESYNDLCNNHKIRQTSNVQFSVNRNFALVCANFWPIARLFNK